MAILEILKDYTELRDLSREDISALAGELRERITSVVLKNGGHLASSLGAVELILSLLRSFDPAEDRILFDVGHQAYAYKLLTGRLDRFDTLRQWEGSAVSREGGKAPSTILTPGTAARLSQPPWDLPRREMSSGRSTMWWPSSATLPCSTVSPSRR
jgi:Deoxyxylulose-5-phosphate synthase